MPHAAIFLLGLGSAFVLKIIGATGLGRQAVKTVMKGGIIVSRHVQTLAAEVTEELQDVAAEANAEVGDRGAKVKEA